MYMGSFRSKISPQDVRTIGMKLSKDDALTLAKALLEYQEIETDKPITLTVHNGNGNVNQDGCVTSILVQDKELPRNYKLYLQD